jgi:hypothetical protein
MSDRKPFGEVFEGKDPDGRGGTHISVTLRRLTPEETAAANLPPDNTVGIFHGSEMIACVDFDDLFDGEGNYFYND